jgi:hypothetical protein
LNSQAVPDVVEWVRRLGEQDWGRGWHHQDAPGECLVGLTVSGLG